MDVNVIIEELQGAESPEEVNAVVKGHTRADFASVCEVLEIPVDSSQNKIDLATAISEVVNSPEFSSPPEETEPEEEPETPVPHPVIKVNDRLEFIPLDPKLGGIAIVDGKIAVHIPLSKVTMTVGGPHIGRF